jgi:hypothetical protein
LESALHWGRPLIIVIHAYQRQDDEQQDLEAMEDDEQQDLEVVEDDEQ